MYVLGTINRRTSAGVCLHVRPLRQQRRGSAAHQVSRSHRKVVKRYEVDKLCDRETRQKNRVKIGGAIEHLLELGDKPVEELWLDFKETSNEIT